MSFPRSLSEFRSLALAAVNVVADHFGGDDLVRRTLHDMIKYKRRDDLDEDLIRAVKEKDVGTLVNLLCHGANPDARKPGDLSDGALLFALHKRQKEKATLLLGWGATVTPECLLPAIAGKMCPSVLQYLLENGAELTQDCLLEAFSVRFWERQKKLLSDAANLRLADTVRLLLSWGAPVDGMDRDGKTALMLSKSALASLILLENGASVKLQDNQGKSALIYAVEANNMELVRLLLSCGALVDGTDRHGKTALMFSESALVAQLLLENGASVNLQDN